jgi:acylphosphatase
VPKTIQRQYFVSGRVQGVGYRYFAFDAAQRLGLRGFARNLTDGRVEVVADGKDDALTGLRTELERGPLSSRVDQVTEAEVDSAAIFSEFTIRG